VVVIHDEDARRLGGFFAQVGCHAPKAIRIRPWDSSGFGP
jgi:hypothetical protein